MKKDMANFDLLKKFNDDLHPDKVHNTFEDLLGTVIYMYNVIDAPINPFGKQILISTHNLGFNTWLLQKYGWEAGAAGYEQYLTPNNFVNYLVDTEKEKEEYFIPHKIIGESFKKRIAASIQQLQPQQPPKISSAQMVLVWIYEGRFNITRENANSVIKDCAKEFGYKNTSGDDLYTKFSHYTKKLNRTADPDGVTDKKLRNKITLFKSVIPLVKPEFRTKIQDEINALESKLIHYKR